MIEQFYRKVPEKFKSESGAVFNSGRSAFNKPSPLYILGLNPGGDPEKHRIETLDFHTSKVLNRPEDWSEFRDEPWNRRKPGTTGMQPRILHMFKGLNLEPHQVPASNVIFRRTSGEKQLAGAFDQLAEQCWEFHHEVIEQLGVKVIVCFGGTAGTWVKRRLGAQEKVGEFVETNNRGWRSEAFRNSQGIAVVSVSHPSRAAWQNFAADPTPLVFSALTSAVDTATAKSSLVRVHFHEAD